jgi:hypothetical protein
MARLRKLDAGSMLSRWPHPIPNLWSLRCSSLPDSNVRRKPSYFPPTAGTLLRYLYPLTDERAKRESYDSAAGSSTLVNKYVLANTTVDQAVHLLVHVGSVPIACLFAGDPVHSQFPQLPGELQPRRSPIGQ